MRIADRDLLRCIARFRDVRSRDDDRCRGEDRGIERRGCIQSTSGGNSTLECLLRIRTRFDRLDHLSRRGRQLLAPDQCCDAADVRRRHACSIGLAVLTARQRAEHSHARGRDVNALKAEIGEGRQTIV